MDIETSKFTVPWLPAAAQAIDADAVAYQSARQDAQTIAEELLTRGYSKAAILKGLQAAITRIAEPPQSS